MALYDEEILFVDRELGRLFESLDPMVSGMTRSCCSHLITAKSCSTTTDSSMGTPPTTSCCGYRSSSGGQASGRRGHDLPVSLLDLFPTVLAAFGVAVPAGSPGRSLWPGKGVSFRPVPPTRERTLYGAEHEAIIETGPTS